MPPEQKKRSSGMNHIVRSTVSGDLCTSERDGIFRLRYETFHERLGWKVETRDGMEQDCFDELPTAHYIVARSARNSSIDACWRLLPTTGPNMLRDVFPELLHGLPAPMAPNIWELSRFAVASHRLDRSMAHQSPQLHFGELTIALMVESVRFAMKRGIDRYVTVTTTAIERMLKQQGLNVHRLGAPVRIGDVLTVACFIEINHRTSQALGC